MELPGAILAAYFPLTAWFQKECECCELPGHVYDAWYHCMCPECEAAGCEVDGETIIGDGTRQERLSYLCALNPEAVSQNG